MKKPQLKDFDLTQEFINELKKKSDNIFFKSFERSFWIFVGVIAFFIGSQIDGIRLFSGEYFTVSIFLIFPVSMFLGVSSYLVSAFYNETILPALNKKYLNLKNYKKKLKEYEEWYFRTQLEFWRTLTGRQFEVEFAQLFRKQGHTVKIVGGAGDKGIDIILDNNIAVQCKAHKSKVGPGAIRDLIGSMKNANYKKGILASINGFSKGVYEYNRKNNIQLLDATHYIQLQKKLSDG